MTTAIPPSQLKLPDCPIPRYGERVCWFRGAVRQNGRFIGHDCKGRAVVISDEEAPINCDFLELRIEDPFNRLGPNWDRVASPGVILRPDADVLQKFTDLLDQRTPPGPKYLDLVTEIWSRGFEVYLVGGTVRDIIAGNASKDVDLVTTMPISLMGPLLKSMYNWKESSTNIQNGFTRIGDEKSGEPTIDIRMFSNSYVGSSDAIFGGGFDLDHKHRDFACNALYYEPINQILVDPTGTGLSNALERVLHPICETNNPAQMGQIYIRFAKFLTRGYTATIVVIDLMRSKYANCLGALEMSEKVRCLNTQVVGKSSTSATEALCELREKCTELGHEEIWDTHLAPVVDKVIKLASR